MKASLKNKFLNESELKKQVFKRKQIEKNKFLN